MSYSAKLTMSRYLNKTESGLSVRHKLVFYYGGGVA